VFGCVTAQSGYKKLWDAAVSTASDYVASASSLMEYLLTSHPYRREIAELPDREIERLKGMLRAAVQQAIAPQEIYDAITRGFDRIYGTAVTSPPLAYDLREAAKTTEGLRALLRELNSIG
jgi:hypothetical protein